MTASSGNVYRNACLCWFENKPSGDRILRYFHPIGSISIKVCHHKSAGTLAFICIIAFSGDLSLNLQFNLSLLKLNKKRSSLAHKRTAELRSLCWEWFLDHKEFTNFPFFSFIILPFPRTLGYLRLSLHAFLYCSGRLFMVQCVYY